MKQYLIARLQEASTWRGIIFVVTALGLHLTPEMGEAVITAGLGVAGLVGAAVPDVKS